MEDGGPGSHHLLQDGGFAPVRDVAEDALLPPVVVVPAPHLLPRSLEDQEVTRLNLNQRLIIAVIM